MPSGDDRSIESRASLVGQIADEITDRLRRGEHPTAEEYLRRYPDLAEDLRGVFPALLALRQPPAVLPETLARSEASFERDTVEPGAGSAPRPVIEPKPVPVGTPALEIQALLRKRLLIMSCIAAGIVGTYLAGIVFPLLFHSQGSTSAIGLSSGRMLLSLAIHSVVFVAALAVGALLWGRPLLSVRTLRNIELFSFGLYAAFFAWTASELFYAGWVRKFSEYGPFGVTRLAGFTNVRFLMLIVGYGAFIPNTWRRCLTVTTMIATVPLIIGLTGGLMDEQISSESLRYFLVETGIWMGGAVAIAVFGSYRIAKLQQQVYEARKLGQYLIKRRLGSGGMGEVYLAEHVLLRRPCAVKLIRPERAGNPDIVRRFLREVQVTATLTHPNTVQVFDYGQTEDGTLYYAMEYLSGLTLEELVTHHGPLPAARVVFLLRQLCGALAEAHAVGLIHRDIKPGNVILGNRGGLPDVAKLLDFGLVHRPVQEADETRLTHAGLVFGTPNHMSPEQAAGKTDLDPRSDIYSLGTVAYFLLTGKPPFVRNSIVQTLAAHIGEPLVPSETFVQEVPADLQAVVLRCLAKSPAERFPDARSLDEALASCTCARDWTPATASSWWEAQAPAELTTSALSQLDFRVDRRQFAAGVVDLHLPVDTALSVVDVG